METHDDRRLLWVAVLVVLSSLLVRLPNLGAPLLEVIDFRQAQTAITVQAFLDRGVKVFDYETPVFGPPWRVPFEFPLFQLSAFAVAKLGQLDVDLACRLAALVWFYLSAWLLFLIVRRWVGLGLAVASLAAYVWTPYSILYSRACLIDYTSVGLALGYLYLMFSWLETRQPGSALAAILVGAAAYTVKLTSLPGVLLAMAGAGAVALRRAWRPLAQGGLGFGARLRLLAWLAALASLPLAAGVAWTWWADGIKASTPTTVWLTSANLHFWTFGSWAQRVSWDYWSMILERIGGTLVPGLVVFFVPLALIALRRGGRRLRLAVLIACIGVVAPIVTFFNLYIWHEYYLVAITPFLAVVTGAGVLYLATLRISDRGVLLALAALATLLSARDSWDHVTPAYTVSRDAPIARLGRLVASAAKPEQWVAVEGDDWSSRILYAARRRGFMIRPHADIKGLAARPEFGALVCRDCGPMFALWPRRWWMGYDEVGLFTVFRVWPAAAGGPAALEGRLQRADCVRVKGWVWDAGNPWAKWDVELIADGRVIEHATADEERPALRDAGKGDGRHGFRFPTPGLLRDGRRHDLSIRVADTGLLLTGSKAVLVCPPR